MIDDAPVYVYFVAFTFRWETGNDVKWGSFECEVDRPVTKLGHLVGMQQTCKERLHSESGIRARDLIIVNWQLLRFGLPKALANHVKSANPREISSRASRSRY